MKGLRSIRVLYRDQNLGLWGLPYELRPGQSPRHIAQGPMGDGIAARGWIYLGHPGWFGDMTAAKKKAVQKFLALVKPWVPGNPYEFDVIGS